VTSTRGATGSSPVLLRSTDIFEPAFAADDCYTADILSAPAEIEQLAELVRRLAPAADRLGEPPFFLASLSPEWIPRVVVVRRGAIVAGVMYTKERRVGGFRTGIIYGDGRLGNLVVANPAEREGVVTAAITALFKARGTRAVRLAVPPGGADAHAIAATALSGRFDRGYGDVSLFDLHARLTLTNDYQEFLRRLGPKTRHNFRYYRRKFDVAGHVYMPDLSAHDLQRAATDLRARSQIPIGHAAIRRAVAVLAACDRPWASGLRHRDGSWLSVAGGWFSGGRAFLFTQVNCDRDHASASLSVVHRAHLIETLIERGTSELVFWSGVGSPLSRYALPMPTIIACFDRRTLGWRILRSVIGRSQRWMPKRIAADARWMASLALAPEPPGIVPLDVA
jgi:hypothetical protein